MNINTMKAKMAFLLVLLAIFFVLNAPAARAQGDALKANEALLRTDEIIDNARIAIQESRSQKARLSLDMAAGLQAKAWDSYRNERIPHGPQAHCPSAPGGAARSRPRAVGPAIRAEQQQGDRGDARTPRQGSVTG